MENIDEFAKLGLSQEILDIVHEQGFDKPSEIQKKAIPLALKARDVIGGSATGSGKTLAFAAPIIQNLKTNNKTQALILTPTRELAEQVSRAFKLFSSKYKFNILEVYGGVSIGPQIHKLRRADIVIGTPGRILDHLSRKTIDLSEVRYLVLDEADRMLDMGFLPDVEKIIKQCPRKRQTFLFSATISPEVVAISEKYMKEPKEISVESKVDPSKLEQVFYDVKSYEKFSILVHLLKQEHSKLVMVFSNTKRSVRFLEKNLKQHGINAMALHGDLRQNKRKQILQKFHNNDTFVLVCTDVAARGLDINNVSHVYNYGSPKNSIDYIHRIGRTARAGKEGKAITIISNEDYDSFRNVNQDKTLNIKRMENPHINMLNIVKEDNKQKRNFKHKGRYNRDRKVGDKRRGRGRDNRNSRDNRNNQWKGRNNRRKRNNKKGRGYKSSGFRRR